MPTATRTRPTTPDLLVFCLDGADLPHFAAYGGAPAFPVLGTVLRCSAELPSTVVPQTPVAWSALLCGAEPAETGVWGWQSVDRGGRLGPATLAEHANRYRDWAGYRVLLAGLPLLSAEQWPTGRVLAGVPGPTKWAGGSRPEVGERRDPAELATLWRRHHRGWAEGIGVAAQGARLVLAHCDSVDWFSHRFGPSSPAGRLGWQLAEELLAELVRRLNPAAVVVVSDHGSTELRAVLLIHHALDEAGLGARVTPHSSLAQLADAAVSCRSDYGALWVREPSREPAAEALLRELGAREVSWVDAPGAPRLVPRFEDGVLCLLPPELYPPGRPRSVWADQALVERLRRHNWVGDHSHTGLLGTDDPALWATLAGARLPELKWRWLARLGPAGVPGSAGSRAADPAPATASGAQPVR